MTDALALSADVLPALALLGHHVRLVPADAGAFMHDAATGGSGGAAGPDVVLVDARRELAQARTLCRLLDLTGSTCPVLAVVTEGGLAAVNAEWSINDVILDTAGPAEVEARIRLARGRHAASSGSAQPSVGPITTGELVIDEEAYTARLRGAVLDLTYKEFELLKYLAHHPGRVFTRAQLLQEVWGYDYFGGTRTVDVHVRRLRAKLGSDHETLIGTVRNVGYRFVPDEVEAHAGA